MTSPTRARRRSPRLAVLLTLALVAGACSGTDEDGGASGDGGRDGRADDGEETTDEPPEPVLSPDRADPLPAVTPTPVSVAWLGPDVTVPASVTVAPAADADPAAVDVVTQVLQQSGAEEIVVPANGSSNGGSDGGSDAEDGVGAADLVVHVGPVSEPAIADALAAASVAVPTAGALPPEGYVLAVSSLDDGSARLVLGGADAVGTFYAAQTLRQLATGGTLAGVAVTDHPAMAHRGSIEGFYGSPWTHDERVDHLAFAGRFKLNTYIYAPKDDPYHRDRWREPYPADLADGLRQLIDAATANHVRFTFAMSPGVSICYSDPADLDALVAKLTAVYDLGVRAFSVALDDIDHTRWSCTADADRYGAPSTEAAARAQVDLVNAVQARFIAPRPDALPLVMVPTEYRGTRDSPYIEVLRNGLAPEIEVMWTGVYVVPDEITVEQAGEAAAVYGRPTYVWDNTPVNDFPPTEGRLILAPYARREPGLSAQTAGIVLNPMNQAAASKVQLVGAADFTWNDAAYDPVRAHRVAASYLAGGDPETTDALLTFFDLEHLAPTSASSGIVSQPQAPALAASLNSFRATWSAGDRTGALAALRPVAERIAGAPSRIRAHVADPGFVADCAPWLDATALWGDAFVRTLDGLAARAAGDTAAATAAFAEADALVAQAEAITTIPGETRPQGPVRVGDGVLDDFLADAPSLR